MNVTCPHCGNRTFTVAGWSDVDRCPSCRRALTTRRGDEVERQVREYLYGDPQGTTRHQKDVKAHTDRSADDRR
jgi:tRNA(Ile2) C34 agmatinyltransferase TiaS